MDDKHDIAAALGLKPSRDRTRELPSAKLAGTERAQAPDPTRLQYHRPSKHQASKKRKRRKR